MYNLFYSINSSSINGNNQITQQMKRHAAIVALQADHSYLKIAGFLKVRSLYLKTIKVLDDFIQDVQQTIDNKPKKSMRSLVNNFHVSEGIIINVVHENIKYKSNV